MSILPRLKQMLSAASKEPSAAGRAAAGAAKTFSKPHASSVIHKSFKDLPKDIKKGYRSESIRRGFDSFVGAVPQALAEKAVGAKTVRKAIHKHVNEPALKADMAMGRVATETAKHFMPDSMAEKLFSMKEHVPIRKGIQKEVRRTSAAAPFSHAAEIGKPFAFGLAAERAAAKLRDDKEEKTAAILWSPLMKKVAAEGVSVVSCDLGDNVMVNQQLREKVAHAMLHLHQQNKEHEKRAAATKLLYKQAELGFTELPRSFEEFQVKLASLMREDLAVVEKAMELTGGVMKLGELDSTDTSKPQNSTEAFRAAIIGETY